MTADDASRLEDDVQAREDALDVTQSFIVQAPAGSGKTELLIQRYLCLLGVVDEPEEVVAITFTRKAASEMQLRVIAALERAGRGETGGAPHEQRTLAAARAILERSRERDWQLLDVPRRMRILTLDAFCASITRLLPVSSGLGGNLNTSADATMDRLYREAAAATLDWLTGGDRRADSVARVLAHLDNNVGQYVNYLARMLNKRDQWLGIIGSGDAVDLDKLRPVLEAAIATQVAAHLDPLRERFDELGGEEIRELLRYAARNIEERDGVEHALRDLPGDGWPGNTAEDVSRWRAIADTLMTKNGGLRKTVDVRSGFPTGDDGEKAAFLDWLGTLRSTAGTEELLDMARVLPEPRYRDEQWSVMLALFDVLPLAVAELQRLFAERGMTDHTQVAQAAAAALGTSEDPGELAMLLDYRIRHLLVDEMQDTSISQYRLLTQLTAGWERGDGRTLFCVGDPMQSIYRFRDAEVGQFVAARRHGIGDLALRSLTLRRNFRSGERLVDWFNATFERVLPAADDAATGAVSYSPSVAVERHAGAGRVELHPLIDADTTTEALCSAAIIENCLAEDDSGKVAVLVRGRTQLPLLLAELRRRDIPCEAIEIDRLTDLPEIIELLALTRALSQPSDRLAWLALLRAPWAGLRWRDLHALVRNDSDSTVPELASDAARLATLSDDGRRRLQAMLERLEPYLDAHGARSLRERIECAWQVLGGAACLALPEQLDNAYRYLDVLERLEEAGAVPDIARLEEQLDAERVSTPGDASTRVQVMTMHKAKGLQFDHVVLHGLGRRTAGGDRDVLAWLNVTDREGSSSMILSPLGARADVDGDPLHRFIERRARDSERLEMDRLLYVACTRAIRSLHLVASVDTVKKGSELGKPGSGTLLSRLWPVVEATFETAFAGAAPPADDTTTEADTVLMDPELRRIAERWDAPSPSPPPRLPALATGEPEERPVEYAWVGSAARHAGTIVHRWLQRLADGRESPDDLPARLEPVSRRWARLLGVPADEVEDVVQRTRQAIDAVLADEHGRWLTGGSGHAELKLTGRAEGGTVSIAIDRVREDGDVHWLVDYKTSTHEGGNLEWFLDEEKRRYREQLRRYRDLYRDYSGATVRTALYFPLLQRFVEVDVDETD